ncbi:MAG: Gfo/Idh/MocA family oxidoreductase [Planctomycetota bacterium]
MFRVGIVGCGPQGISKTHLPGWEASPHTEVTACCDVDLASAEAFAKTNSIAHALGSYDDLLADDTIDVIDLAVPTAHHASMTIRALEAGKHVFCEKPLAPTPGEIEEIIAARDAAGKLTCTMQNQRYVPEAKSLKRRFDAGDLGDVYHARLWFLRRDRLPVRPGFIYKEHSGGGPCIDVGVHILDLAMWLMGHRKPVAVTGVARKEVAAQPGAWSEWGGDVPADMDVEDFAAGFIRLDDGATIILEVSWLLHHPELEFKAWFYGQRGGAIFPDATLFHSDNEAKEVYDVQLTPRPESLKGHALCCIDFAEALATGGQSPVPAEQSLAVMRILDALYESSRTGREVLL